jgi:imidazolonepropionase-like amidohydrolase
VNERRCRGTADPHRINQETLMSQTVFRNVKIIDGSGARPFAGEVLVEGNRIREVGPRVAGAAGARVVDGAGAVLMPGLVESHSHLSFLDTADLESLGAVPVEEHLLRTLKNAKKMLDQGFTSCVSAAAAKPRLDIVLRNAIDAGDHPGPRTLAATPELTVSGGLGDVNLWHMQRSTFALICDGPDEFRKTARQMVREGVDTLKINPSGDEFVPHSRASQTVMTEAEIAAVCEVGRAHGKVVAAHARSAGAVKLCVKHGVQRIYHATLCDDEALAALEGARADVFVSPTLGITVATLYEAGPWGLSTEAAENMGMKRELDIAIGNMKKLRAAGVRLLPGGDYGFAWNPIGRNARDLEHFVTLLGYTPLEAIHAATALGGQMMGRGDELGVLKAGALADLLLVDGDPSLDVTLLQDASRLLGIMKDGRFHKDPAQAAIAARAAALAA